MDLERTVRRNTIVLATTMALNWAVITLAASLITPTIGVLFALPELAGSGFALFLVAIGVGGLITGRLMDRWSRRSGLQAAYAAGAAGAALLWLGVGEQSIPAAFAGLLILGLGTGGANLARAAGADMYPPERRPRGIAFVLLGAAVGAIGSPIVFAPLLTGVRAGDAGALATPWLVAAALMLAGALVLFLIRVDPRAIAERLRAAASVATLSEPPSADARPLAVLLRLPLVPLALLAAVVAQAVMSSVMALAGLILVRHGHDPGAVIITLSVHFVGMFGLVLVVGRMVESVGRFRSVLVGLLVLAGGTLVLLPGAELIYFMPGMFLVGVGWNIAFVASTAILADVARTSERGRMLGFSDFLAIGGAAGLSIIAGLVLEFAGLSGLVVVGVLLSIIPAALIALNRDRLENLRQLVVKNP